MDFILVGTTLALLLREAHRVFVDLFFLQFAIMLTSLSLLAYELLRSGFFLFLLRSHALFFIGFGILGVMAWLFREDRGVIISLAINILRIVKGS